MTTPVRPADAVCVNVTIDRGAIAAAPAAVEDAFRWQLLKTFAKVFDVLAVIQTECIDELFGYKSGELRRREL